MHKNINKKQKYYMFENFKLINVILGKTINNFKTIKYQQKLI